MHWLWNLRAAGVALILAVAGCDQGVVAPPSITGPGPAEAHADPGLRAHEGQSYAEFSAVPELARYAPAGLGIGEAGQRRFERAMSQSAPGWIVEGGGLSALVIVGCDASACADAAAILAIDLASGEAYGAVRDASGRDVLLGNDRLQALVEATTPADRWADPEAWAGGAPGEGAPS